MFLRKLSNMRAMLSPKLDSPRVNPSTISSNGLKLIDGELQLVNASITARQMISRMIRVLFMEIKFLR